MNRIDELLEKGLTFIEEDKKHEEDTQQIIINNDFHYNCDICGNKTLIPYIDEFGETSYKKCNCGKIRESIERSKKSGMDKLLHYRFEDYKLICKYHKIIFNLAKKYLEIGSKYKLSFGMFGQSGVGKSMICGIICNELLKKGKSVLYIPYDEIRTKFIESKISNNFYNEEINNIYTVEVLYIDDLFKGLINDFHIDVVFHLINYRYNKGLITLFSSELLLSEIAKLNVALCGRIVEMCREYYIEIEEDSNKNFRRLFAKGLKIKND